jgi:hypothetical protein
MIYLLIRPAVPQKTCLVAGQDKIFLHYPERSIEGFLSAHSWNE